jgi:hypothetical protein
MVPLGADGRYQPQVVGDLAHDPLLLLVGHVGSKQPPMLVDANVERAAARVGERGEVSQRVVVPTLLELDAVALVGADGGEILARRGSGVGTPAVLSPAPAATVPAL